MLAAAVIGVMSVEAFARARLLDASDASPTRFYARPLVLEAGGSIDRDQLLTHFERLGYRRVSRADRVGSGEYYLGSRRWVIGRRSIRRRAGLEAGRVVTVDLGYRDRVWRLRDDRDQWLESFALEPERLPDAPGLAREEVARVELAELPDHLVDAVLTIEDRHFYTHDGIHLKRIAGAALANARAGRVVQGGSTITQQLAKALFLSPRRTLMRKLRELAMAVVLERRYDKNTILTAYLNNVYLGQDAGYAIRGVGPAAQFYFGKDVSRLRPAESALLAAMLKGPSLYSPVRNADRALERRNLVLRLMHEQELLSDSAYASAQETPVTVAAQPARSRRGRYFVDYAASELERIHGDDALTDGLSVFTTLDLELQRLAERAVATGLRRLESAYPRLVASDERLQVALVALDPRSGDVMAMVGGRDYGASQFNRAVNAYRQPGSAFKPVVALAALAGRTGITLASVLDDEPLALETTAGVWRPANYDGDFRGEVTVRDAIERSLNVPFARLGVELGAERIVETARRLGVESRLNAVPSLALGSSEVSPLELTRAFSVLAAEGYRADARSVLGVIESGGDVVPNDPSGNPEFTAAEAYVVTSALRGVVERGTGRGLRRSGFRGDVAGKSGTTNDFRDAWFVGYTPTLAVGVWVGFDDGRSTGLTGSGAALPIFADFVMGAEGREGAGRFRRPLGVDVVRVSRRTERWGRSRCSGELEVFLVGTAPRDGCGRYAYESRRSGYRTESIWDRRYDERRGRRGGRTRE